MVPAKAAVSGKTHPNHETPELPPLSNGEGLSLRRRALLLHHHSVRSSDAAARSRSSGRPDDARERVRAAHGNRASSG